MLLIWHGVGIHVGGFAGGQRTSMNAYVCLKEFSHRSMRGSAVGMQVRIEYGYSRGAFLLVVGCGFFYSYASLCFLPHINFFRSCCCLPW